MSGMTGILGGWPRHLAAAALIVVLCAACGRLDSNIPSDGEMIEIFKTKEKTFSEIVELFQEFPSWEGDNPGGNRYRDGYWPESAESRGFFGEERALRISKSFVYCSDPIDSLALKSEIGYLEYSPSTIFMADGDLDSLYYDIRTKANDRKEGISFINLKRRIADNWLIELEYFH